MQLFNRYVSNRSLTVFAGELCLIFGSVALAAFFQQTPNLWANLWKVALVSLICQLCLADPDLEARLHPTIVADPGEALSRGRRHRPAARNGAPRCGILPACLN